MTSDCLSISTASLKRLPGRSPEKENEMAIAIIVAGAVSAAFAQARAGIEATISNSRSPDSLKAVGRELVASIKESRTQ
jgi:hypothetical protein